MKYKLLLSVGFHTSEILSEISNMVDGANKMYHIHELRLRVGLKEQNKFTEAREQISDFLISKMSSINNEIKLLNNKLIELDPKYKKQKVMLMKCGKIGLKKDLLIFYNKMKYDPDTFKFVSSNFDNYIVSKVSAIIDELRNIIVIIQDVDDDFNINKVPTKYKNQIREVIDLYFIGYRCTSLLVLGKVFEDVVTRYLLKLIKDNKINRKSTDILDKTFENKLGILKNEKKLSEKDWLIISKLKFDRNIGGHPQSRVVMKETELESEATIKLALGLLNKIDKLI